MIPIIRLSFLIPHVSLKWSSPLLAKIPFINISPKCCRARQNEFNQASKIPSKLRSQLEKAFGLRRPKLQLKLAPSITQIELLDHQNFQELSKMTNQEDLEGHPESLKVMESVSDVVMDSANSHLAMELTTEELMESDDPFAALSQNALTFSNTDEEPPAISENMKEGLSKKMKKKLERKRKQLEARVAKKELKKPTPRLNHFVAIQVTSPEIKEQVKLIQDRILASPLPPNFKFKEIKKEHSKKNKKKVTEQSNESVQKSECEQEKSDQTSVLFKDAMERLESLHFTLSVLALNNQEEIQRAKDVMESCWTKHKATIEESPIDLDVHGLGHFSNKVIFAKIKNEEHITRLQSLAKDLQEEFVKSDIHTNSAPFKAHMTIAKLSRSKTLYKKKVRAFPFEIWNDHELHYFGKQSVQSIQLLEMSMDPKTNYYKLICEHKLASDGNKEQIT